MGSSPGTTPSSSSDETELSALEFSGSQSLISLIIFKLIFNYLGDDNIYVIQITQINTHISSEYVIILIRACSDIF